MRMTVSNDDSETSSTSSTSVQGNDPSSASSTSSSSPSLSPQDQLRKIKRQSAQKIQALAKDAAAWMNKYSDSNVDSSNSDGNNNINNSDELLTNPMKVYAEIKSISDEMLREWGNYRDKIRAYELEQKVNEEDFRVAYMNAITEAFADELEDLRQGKIRKDVKTKPKKKTKKGADMDIDVDADADILKQDNIVMPDDEALEKDANGGSVDLQVLVYMLENGMENWSEEEKKLFVEMKMDNTQGSGSNQNNGSSQSENDINIEVGELTPHEKRRRALFGTLQY